MPNLDIASFEQFTQHVITIALLQELGLACELTAAEFAVISDDPGHTVQVSVRLVLRKVLIGHVDSKTRIRVCRSRIGNGPLRYVGDVHI